MGNTPAEAGKTRFFPARFAGRRKHPRRGGEDVGSGADSRELQETPPPRRGRLPVRSLAKGVLRNTPAEAGKTLANDVSEATPRKHPRRGGEDHDFHAGDIRIHETPPPRRGRQQHMVAVC